LREIEEIRCPLLPHGYARHIQDEWNATKNENKLAAWKSQEFAIASGILEMKEILAKGDS